MERGQPAMAPSLRPIPGPVEGVPPGTGVGPPPAQYDGHMSEVIPGLEVLLDDPAPVGDRRWALLANHAAVTRGLDPARVRLAARLDGPLVRLLAPEHGLDGVAQDMEPVADARDPLTGAAVRSLYGRDAASLELAREDLDGVDALLVDLPDIGTRYYTFAATLDAAMAAAESAGVEVVVLDRPNPIGGVVREGGMVRSGFESFVGRVPVPVRHGLTLGEIALLLHRERYPGLDLTVIACRGWRRARWWDETGLPWVPPSPNMPTLEAAALYPGLCLVEATTLSEGRGTTRPFNLVGAPWVAGPRLVDALRALRLPGIGLRAARFRPQFGKHAGQVCSGVELHVRDRDALEPLALGLHLLATVRELHPDRFAWRAEPYEFVADRAALDLLTGSSEARARIEAGAPLEPLLEAWRGEVATFESTLDGILLSHDR